MQSLARMCRAALPVLLAALAVFLAAAPTYAGEIEIRKVSENVLEVAGGEGAQAWSIRYGTLAFRNPLDSGVTARVAPGEGDRAWFAHGGWLRLIDTRRGLVIGRWRFPGTISNLKPAGDRVEVEMYDEAGIASVNFRRTVTFDPAAPRRPEWPANNFLWLRLPRTEADVLGSLAQKLIPREDARRRLAQLEQTLARDAHSPTIFLSHGRLLQALGDARSRESFERAVRVPEADFTELLPISSYLDEFGEHALAREAFDRGYRDFWQRGYDPRLVFFLVDRLILYGTPLRDRSPLPAELDQEIIERIYRLAPYDEAAELAWSYQAVSVARTGSPESARLWEERASDAVRSNEFANFWFGLVPDNTILLMMAVGLGVLLYVFVLYHRYHPQRKLDLAARERLLGPRPTISLAWLKKCSPLEIGLYILVAVGVYAFVFWRLPLFESVFAKVIMGTFLLTPFTALYLIVMYARHRGALPGPAVPPGDDFFFEFKQWDGRRWATFLTVTLVAWYFMASTAYTPLQFWSDWTGGTYGKNQEDPWWLWFGALFAFPACSLNTALVVVYLFFDWPRRRRARQQAGIPRRLAFFGLEYWSRRDRFGFLLMVLAAWLAVGMLANCVQGILRVAGAPVALATGNLAGPMNTWWLENRLPQSPERDLWLAVSYHRSGENEKAERLYRSLPQSAIASNNLGVLLKDSGREAEAQQAWRRALELDPSLAEAALNLGQPPASLWTEFHREYNPGRPMLAPPPMASLARAAMGGSWTGAYTRLLAGPFRLQEVQKATGTQVAKPLPFFFLLVMALALAMNFLIPSREVTVAPSPRHAVWETLLPGTSPTWGIMGGLLLWWWMYFLVQGLLLAWKDTSRILTFITIPNLSRNYAVPGLTMEELLRIGGPINPGWTWVLVVPLVIFAVNFYLVWRGRRAA
jgi:tetratricopeptide (TPR) repeat protein